MECCRIISYLLYGSVASLSSPSSNIEAWPYGTSLRFASLLHSGHKGYVNISDYFIKFRSELSRSHSKIWYVDLRTNSDFRSRSFDLFPPTHFLTFMSKQSKKISPVDCIVAGLSSFLVVFFCYWYSGWYGVPYFRCRPRVCVFSPPT